MDAVQRMLMDWRDEARTFERVGEESLVRLTDAHARDLAAVLAALADTPVPYEFAEQLTGWSLGGLRNTLPNIGTRSAAAFRLGSLPFKAGKASDGKLLLAASSVIHLTSRG
jgi:hypothetical protein